MKYRRYKKFPEIKLFFENINGEYYHIVIIKDNIFTINKKLKINTLSGNRINIKKFKSPIKFSDMPEQVQIIAKEILSKVARNY